ncbi:MAG: DUF3568 family protein [Victivallales bacterium]|jgi:hypothetical protein|nr:DUF3568 family protein [Victivallales bacterium]MBT7304607.1 DUF3568 family protein [Victivallales bacterium]
MNSVRTALLVTSLALASLTTGCVAILAGAAGAAGGIVYTKGQLESHEPESFDTVVAAIRKTVKSEQFGDTSATIKDDAFSVRGTDVDGTHVWISARRKESGSTRLRVRHGVVGDKEQAQRLLNAIRAQYR